MWKKVRYLLLLLLLLFDFKRYIASVREHFVDSKKTIEEGNIHIQFKIKKKKIYFLIPSVDVSETVQQANQKPKVFFCSQDDILLSCWNDIKSNPFEKCMAPHNSIDLTLKLKK